MPSLKTYYAKRDFTKTAEPRGTKHKNKELAKGAAFVIQKHDASRLHYDLRLELDGVMLSWAVAKGPSLVPGEKRLAIHVEDHPIEYNKFEGTIPKGQYGGGTVMIWDRGKWYPEGDPHRAMQKGHLDFSVEGKKLQGRWHLVRMRKRPGERQEAWLLIKSDDKFARSDRDPDILEEEPNSVATGRSLEEIAGAKKGRVWLSNREPKDQAKSQRALTKAARPASSKARPRAAQAKPSKAKSDGKKGGKGKKKRGSPALDAAAIKDARRAKLPDFIAPALATLSAQPPREGHWVHEIKFDGYRMQARVEDGRARLLTRNALDWTTRFAPVVDALHDLPVQDAVLDGEIVVEEKDGIPSFSALQETLKGGRGDFIFYLFDLLYLDGYDLTQAPLVARKGALEALLSDLDPNGMLRFSAHFASEGSVLLRHACELNLEGIISKRGDAPYRSGRVGDWMKIKCSANQEFVVAGYEPSATNSRTIRALLLAYYDKDGLRYAGRVGTGFNVKVERDIALKLDELRTDQCPFDKIPPEERRRKVKWVKPQLVAEVDFRGWTHGEVLRQASFKGLREDKKPEEVVREKMTMRSAAATQSAATKLSKSAPSKAAPSQTRSSKPRKLLAKKSSPVSYSGVTLTHPDRVYWSDAGITKKDLAEFYTQIWDWIAPHLVDRPLALVRCPEGANSRNCFFQKHASAGLEAGKLKSVKIKGEEPMIAVPDLAGLIALVQAGVLEIHTWGTVAGEIDTCNRLVFDLDPGPGVSFTQLKEGARDVRGRLKDLGLKSFLKTTGGKGLHVVVPITPADWDIAKNFAHDIADQMTADDPSRYVATMAKKLRNNKIFVDYLRNGKGATAIAPYSTRARPGATVSVPISWEDLGKLEAPNIYDVPGTLRRLKGLRRDPWAEIGKTKQSLPKGAGAKGRRR